jgi:ATP-binding cassette, subfamily G (WHITE), member 2, PDR
MTNLRREPGAFFFFLLVSFLTTLTMSMFFRTIASLSRSLPGAMAPAAILILAIVIYTGFAIPVNYMHGWARWINYVDPVAYGFESLMINEFHNRDFPCSVSIPAGPGYPAIGTDHTVCTTVGSKPGAKFVNGDDYLNSAFQYYHSHKWRNVGIVIVFLLGLMVAYLVAAELVREKKSKGEVLLFRRGEVPAALKESPADEEAADTAPRPINSKGALEKQTTMFEGIQRQEAIFSWKDVCYEVKIKNETRVILDHVDGWVKPGTLTALMVSCPTPYPEIQ